MKNRKKKITFWINQGVPVAIRNVRKTLFVLLAQGIDAIRQSKKWTVNIGSISKLLAVTICFRGPFTAQKICFFIINHIIEETRIAQHNITTNLLLYLPARSTNASFPRRIWAPYWFFCFRFTVISSTACELLKQKRYKRIGVKETSLFRILR